ncbi:uncharacterized protein LOC121143723 [Mesocricetus auratus]|uniref:Uncharacterized protein LOC121143723 n=1 Tax=Mesocricetus auratus TaxID=10036 RepID=A0ABM2YBD6_MESAU|nr:uncharacterized protein LOC121143723 [Mesocricetus auratus]
MAAEGRRPGCCSRAAVAESAVEAAVVAASTPGGRYSRQVVAGSLCSVPPRGSRAGSRRCEEWNSGETGGCWEKQEQERAVQLQPQQETGQLECQLAFTSECWSQAATGHRGNQSIQALTMHLENGKEEKSKLLKEIDRLNHENSILQSIRKHQEEEILALKTNQSESFQSFIWDLENHKEKICKLRKERARLTHEISALEATTKRQAEECKNSLATKDGIIQSLTCSLEDGKKTISELEKEITRLTHEISALEATTKRQAEECKNSLATKVSPYMKAIFVFISEILRRKFPVSCSNIQPPFGSYAYSPWSYI